MLMLNDKNVQSVFNEVKTYDPGVFQLTDLAGT